MHMHTRMRMHLGTNTCTRRSYSNQTLTILSSAPFPKGTPATSQQLEGADSVNPVGIKPDNQSCTLPGVNRYDEFLDLSGGRERVHVGLQYVTAV